MTKQELKMKVEEITGGSDTITVEQLEALEEMPYTWLEDCGASGKVLDGTLYSVRLMDKDGNDTGEEVAEVVLIK